MLIQKGAGEAAELQLEANAGVRSEVYIRANRRNEYHLVYKDSKSGWIDSKCEGF